MEDKATAAIGNADPDANEYLAHTHRARAAMRKARTDLDNQVAFHRCSSPGDEGCGEDGLIARA
jgi:hypothetical protein